MFSEMISQRMFLKKVRFLFGIRAFLSFCCNFRPPSSKKSENQKILYSPVGGKKTIEFVSPQKNILARANLFITSEKSAFPYWNLVHSSISLQFQPPSSKKSENQKILYSPVGGKKTTEFVLPKKRIFWQEQLSLCSKQEPKSMFDHFMFKVGVKIDA